MSKNYFLSILILAGLALGLALPVQAVCPVCTIAVGTCVGLARWLKIDDTITGLWIGGLIVSMIVWTISWLNKKNWRFLGRKVLTVVLYYLLIILPLYFKGIIGHPANTCGGVDKLLLGISIGSAGFGLGSLAHYYLKKRRGYSYFPFQKVVFAIVPLIILSVIFYFVMQK